MPNQTAAQKMTGWNVKSVNNLIKGNKIENFEKGTPAGEPLARVHRIKPTRA